MGEEQVGSLLLGVTAGSLGPLVHWLARRAATGRLRRNILVGIRTSKTMASDDSWVTGHRGALPWTARTATCTAVLGALAVLLGLLGPWQAAIVLGLAAVGGVLGGSLMSVRAAHRAIRAARH